MLGNRLQPWLLNQTRVRREHDRSTTGERREHGEHRGKSRKGTRERAPVDSGPCLTPATPARAATAGSTAARPTGPGTAGRVWRFRRVGPRRGGRQPDLLRALCPPAPRPGVGRHRGEQRPADLGLQGHGARVAGLRRDHAGLAQGPPGTGHARYSTTGASTWENAQPTFRPTADGSIALGHNGNLINTHDLRGIAADLPGPADGSSTCTPRTTRPPRTTPARHRAARPPPGHLAGAAGARGAAAAARRVLDGSMNEDTLYAARDPQGSARWSSGAWTAAGWSPASRPPWPRDRRQRRPRGRARRDDRDRRERPARPPLRRAAAQGLRVRVRLPRPPRRHHRGRSVHESRSRWVAAWPASSRSRPTW